MTAMRRPMLARVWSCALAGLQGQRILVEVDIHPGLPHVTIVGLPGAAVREAKDRLFAALRNAGFKFPMARVTINLAPASVRKSGPSFDMPMALGLLLASRQLKADLREVCAYGEVALDGTFRATAGVLPVADFARRQGFTSLVVPEDNGPEAALIPTLMIAAPPDLHTLVAHFQGNRQLPTPSPPSLDLRPEASNQPDLLNIYGQEQARRALEIAAAGGHNLLLTGPPGAGKTLLARCTPSILPPMTFTEALDVTAVYSVAGTLPTGAPLVRSRPFRAPHHTISPAGLVGGGSPPRPGEISLAHRGVLFLDELPEFDRRALEVLRGPLEDGHLTLARATGAATFPAAFTLVAARNPCPCGYYEDHKHDCACSPADVARYSRRISGPLLDRFDLHLAVPRVDPTALVGSVVGEASEAVRRRVVLARQRQTDRLGEDAASPSLPGNSAVFSAPSHRHAATCNGTMTVAQVRATCRPSPEAVQLLNAALRRLTLSARAYHRVLKVARTIADLDASVGIEAPHVAEALMYRPRSPRL